MSLGNYPNDGSQSGIPHFSPRDVPALHGSTARLKDALLSSRSSGQAFRGACTEAPPGLAGGWAAPCPRLASQPGGRWPGSRAQARTMGPLDGPAHTTQTLMAWWPQHGPLEHCSGPELWIG